MPSRRRRAALWVWIGLGLPAAAGRAADGSAVGVGAYSDGRLTATWSSVDPASGACSGTVAVDGRTFPATGRAAGDTVTGSFDAGGGHRFDLTETFNGDTATLVSGSRSRTLRRVVAAQPAAPAAGGLLGAAPATAVVPAAGPPRGTPGEWHVRKVSMTDICTRTGPDDPGIVAATMLVPAGWTASAHSAMAKVADAFYTPPRLALAAHDAAGTTGVTILPGGPTVWTDNRQLMRQVEVDNQQFGRVQVVQLLRPRPVEATLREFAGQPWVGQAATGDPARPMADLRAVGEPVAMPAEDAQLQVAVRQANDQLAEAARQVGSAPPTVAAAVARQRLAGTLDGRPVEAWLCVLLTTRTEPLPPGQGSVTVQDAPLIVLSYAPAGRLDESQKLLSSLLDTVQVRPAWEQNMRRFEDGIRQVTETAKAKVNAIHQQMMDDNLRTQQKIAAIQAGTAAYAADVRGQVAAHRSAALSHSAQQFALYAGNQAAYRDPATGDRVQVPGGYAHAWASTTGTTTDYILTDSPSYDPNGHAGSGSWTELQEEK